MPVSPDEAKRLRAPVSGDGIEANPLGAPRVSGYSHLEVGSCHVARRQASGFAGHQVRPISAAASRFRSSSRRSFPCGSRRRRRDLNGCMEIKLDGYRMAARIDNGDAQLLTKTGLDWTAKYPSVIAALSNLPTSTASSAASNHGGGISSCQRRRGAARGRSVAGDRADRTKHEVRILQVIEIEHMRHGGVENGNLIVTRRQLEKRSIPHKAIAPGLRALEALGFIEITQRGAAGNRRSRSNS